MPPKMELEHEVNGHKKLKRQKKGNLFSKCDISIVVKIISLLC